MGINTQYIQAYSDSIIGIINGILVPVLMAIAFIVFLYGVYLYFIQGSDNEEQRKTGRTYVLYGVIGFVIITALWGLVNIVDQTLLPSSVNRNTPRPPTINFGGSSSSNVPARTDSFNGIDPFGGTPESTPPGSFAPPPSSPEPGPTEI